MDKVALSKYMSLILRHHPEVIGISLDRNGWADAEELVRGISQTHDFSREMLDEIVRTDSKKRYSFNDDRTKIRAAQGHSVPVDVELEEREPPARLWHGTGLKYTASIDRQGLIPGERLYVHLSADMKTALTTGARHDRPEVYIVKAREMYRDGFRFFLSANGVWLTKRVPVDYLVRV